MTKRDYKTAGIFTVKVLLYLLLLPFWAVWAAIGRTDFERYIRRLERLWGVVPKIRRRGPAGQEPAREVVIRCREVYCPKCKRHLYAATYSYEIIKEKPYCLYCGQRLSWRNL